MDSSPPDRKNARILLVDRENPRLQSLQRTLQTRGIETETAANRHEALELLQRCPADLVIVNMHMPHAEGIGALIAIRGFSPVIRIIAVSDESVPGRNDFLPLAMSLGASSQLRGGLDCDRLLDAIQGALSPDLRQVAC